MAWSNTGLLKVLRELRQAQIREADKAGDTKRAAILRKSHEAHTEANKHTWPVVRDY